MLRKDLLVDKRFESPAKRAQRDDSVRVKNHFELVRELRRGCVSTEVRRNPAARLQGPTADSLTPAT